MDKVLKEVQDCAVVCINDILMLSPTWASYYQRPVPYFAMLATPLTDLLKGQGKET